MVIIALDFASNNYNALLMKLITELHSNPYYYTYKYVLNLLLEDFCGNIESVIKFAQFHFTCYI